MIALIVPPLSAFSRASISAGRAAQVALQHLDLDAHAARGFAPDDREAAAFEYQDLVAPAEHVGERGFPGAVAVGDVNVGAAGRLEHARDVAQQALGQVEQRPGIDVHRRPVHGPQHLVRHCRRPRNGEEFTPCSHAHRSIPAGDVT
jgi:hypothetical protein